MSGKRNKLGFVYAFHRHISNFVAVTGLLLIVSRHNAQSSYPLICPYLHNRTQPRTISNCSGLGIYALTGRIDSASVQVNFSSVCTPHLLDSCHEQRREHDVPFRSTRSIYLSNTNKHLEVLDLSFNFLSYVPDILPESLKELYLSRNRIVDIEVKRPTFLDHLQIMYVGENAILRISNRTNTGGNFWQNMHVVNLQKLALHKNEIESIDANAFLHLRRLTALSLSHNRLRSLNEDAFNGLNRLIDLDLSHNFLFHIDDYAFNRLSQLVFLSLRHNQLASLPKGVPMLEWFDVSHNALRNISDDLKPELMAVEFLNFAHNPLHCDCTILWLKEVYDRREYIVNYVDFDPSEIIPSCSSPSNLAKETWDLLSDDLFMCEDERERTSEERKETIPELHVQGQVFNDSSVEVVWKFKNVLSTATQVVIYYYVFGSKSTTSRQIRVSATENRHVLKNLSAQTNYMICVNFARSQAMDVESVEKLPLLLEQCIEITTRLSSQPHSGTTYLTIYWWYIVTMVTTFLTVICCICGMALWCSLCSRRSDSTAKSTYPVDEPLPNAEFNTYLAPSGTENR